MNVVLLFLEYNGNIKTKIWQKWTRKMKWHKNQIWHFKGTCFSMWYFQKLKGKNMSIDHEGNRRKWEKLLFSTIHIIQVHVSFRAVKRIMNFFQINSIALLQKFQEPGISQRGLLVLQRLLILLMLLRKVKPVIIGHLVSRLRSLGWWWICLLYTSPSPRD